MNCVGSSLCAVWYEASRCAGNNVDGAIRVFVHRNRMKYDEEGNNVTVWFELMSTENNRNCWYVSGNANLRCLPKDAYVAYGPFDYEDCQECLDDTGTGDGGADGIIGGPGGGSGGGGGGNGGNGGTGGGGGGGGDGGGGVGV